MAIQKSKQSGNILMGILGYVLLGFVSYFVIISYEHLHSAMGGVPFDPVYTWLDFMWATLIYSLVFVVAAIPIVLVSVVVAATWPIWAFCGMMFYTGELIWLIRLTLSNIGVNV